MGEVRGVVTYQDSCHLAHGQRIRSAPRELLRQVPGLTLKEMPMSDLCCGSAGIYNVVHTDMALALLEKKMRSVNSTGAERIVTRTRDVCYSFARGSNATATANAYRTWWKCLTKPIAPSDILNPSRTCGSFSSLPAPRECTAEHACAIIRSPRH